MQAHHIRPVCGLAALTKNVVLDTLQLVLAHKDQFGPVRNFMELFGFGSHLIVDCYNANRERLNDADFICQVLNALPAQMGMRQISPAQVFARPGIHPDMAGTSGVVRIAESHIALHAFPKKGILTLDVFSSKEFETQTVVAVLAENFEMGRIETSFINRGRELPHDPETVERIISGEREYVETRIV